MIILGHPAIACEPFVKVSNLLELDQTPPNSVVFFMFDQTLLDFCQKNNIACAVAVDEYHETIEQTITKVMFCHAFDVRFIVFKTDAIYEAMKVAQNYLFDAKLLKIVNDEKAIGKEAMLGIDGVLIQS